MNRSGGFVIAIAMVSVSAPSAHASWLSKITGIHINPSAGHFYVEAPQPQAIPEMLQNLPKDAAQFLLNPTGSALAEAIRISRNQAIGGGSTDPPVHSTAACPLFSTRHFGESALQHEQGGPVATGNNPSY
jgi:hypothetical protein